MANYTNSVPSSRGKKLLFLARQSSTTEHEIGQTTPKVLGTRRDSRRDINNVYEYTDSETSYSPYKPLYNNNLENELQENFMNGSPFLTPVVNKTECTDNLEIYFMPSPLTPLQNVCLTSPLEDSTSPTDIYLTSHLKEPTATDTCLTLEDPTTTTTDTGLTFRLEEPTTTDICYIFPLENPEMSTTDIGMTSRLEEPTTTGICSISTSEDHSAMDTDSTQMNPVHKSQALKRKKTVCPYCKDSVTNFERHIVRRHQEEKEVTELLQFPVNSKERRDIIGLLRNEGHFQEFMKGNVIPSYKHPKNASTDSYIPCGYCKGIYFKSYLARHSKKCKAKIVKERGARHLSASQTLIASASQFGDSLSKMRIKSEVFSIMKADDVSLIAKTDPLIVQFGENYLKKHKRPQINTCCSNKIRELARLLIVYRKKKGNNNCSINDMLNPVEFQQVVNCAKEIGGYDEEKKTFAAPSLSAHIGTSLKQISDICIKLLLQKSRIVQCVNTEEKIREVTRFKKLVETLWTTEISSIAFKDLNEKKWQKPTILPLTENIVKFKNFALQMAEKNKVALKENPNDVKAYKNLMQCTLAMTILFNRRRIGDVQYLKISEYLSNPSSHNLEEYQLSKTEKILTSQYKRVSCGGKGSRKIIILFPPFIQDFIDVLLETRNQTEIVPCSNNYLFAVPGKEKWARGDCAIRKIAKDCGIPSEGISSNNLRKQIATVMQLLNMTKEETRQFAQFMGHTEKTHNEFYVLPQDLYQTAKISKLLIMIDKGQGKEYLGKRLDDIDINPTTEYPLSDSDNDDEPTEIENVEESTINTEFIEVNKEKPKRASWTKQEKELVMKHFKNHIEKKIAPKKEETLLFKIKYPELFQDKDWVKIKTFVYNQYRLQ